MSDINIHGTCGVCGGPVITYRFWGSSLPQIPKCQNCHREVAGGYGPKLPMKEPVTITTNTVNVIGLTVGNPPTDPKPGDV